MPAVFWTRRQAKQNVIIGGQAEVFLTCKAADEPSGPIGNNARIGTLHLFRQAAQSRRRYMLTATTFDGGDRWIDGEYAVHRWGSHPENARPSASDTPPSFRNASGMTASHRGLIRSTARGCVNLNATSSLRNHDVLPASTWL